MGTLAAAAVGAVIQVVLPIAWGLPPTQITLIGMVRAATLAALGTRILKPICCPRRARMHHDGTRHATTQSSENRTSEEIRRSLRSTITLVTGALAAIVAAPLVPLCLSIVRGGFGLTTGEETASFLAMLSGGYAFAAILGAPFSGAVGLIGGALLLWRSRRRTPGPRLTLESVVGGALLASIATLLLGNTVRTAPAEVIACAAGVGAAAAAATLVYRNTLEQSAIVRNPMGS